MYCKNCGANMPDGVVFCTSCGARFDQMYQQQPAMNQQPVQNQQIPSVSEIPAYEEKPAKKKKGKVAAFISAFASILLIVGIRFGVSFIVGETSDAINRNSGSEASNQYEELAVDYMNYVMVTSNPDAFMDDMAFDMVSFTEDVVEYLGAKNNYTAETFYAYVAAESNKNIYDAESFVEYDYEYNFDWFQSKIVQEFGSTATTFAVKSCKQLDLKEVEELYAEMNTEITKAGLDVSSYVDKDLVSEVYKVNINCVYDEVKQSDDYQSYENLYVYVVNYNGECKVLYDDFMIKGMIESWFEE